jgi:archaellum component FlaG (FlaF/FlaG flagellin family)
MGMGDGVSQTIFFIAGITLATAVVVMASGALTQLSGDIGAHAQDLGKRLKSDIKIINDPAHVPASPLTLYVKNTGSQRLLPSLWTVLVDGSVQTGLGVDVLGSADDTNLGQAQVAQLQVSGLSLASGDHTARVIAETGVYDDLSFTTG